MKRIRPPFRADHVGSLLRPAGGHRSAGRDRRRAPPVLVALRLPQGLDGVESHVTDQGIQFRGVQTRAEGIRVTGRLGFSGHPMLDHFRFLRDHARVVPKMTIPSPSVLHFRGGRAGISREAYPDLDGFLDDLARVYRQVVRAFAEAGCRYLQLDDTVWAYLCSEEQREQARRRGDDPAALPAIYARVINHAIEDRPGDMTIIMHMCRGNVRSTCISEGSVEPLRFLPRGTKQVVLGLVTSKSGALERKDDITRRIAEAGRFVDPERLCPSPQCGLASTEEGNVLTEDEQWAKLAMTVEVAREVWA